MDSSVQHYPLDTVKNLIPKISPSIYKPLQIQAPQTRNAKNPLLNRPSKYKPPPLPQGFYLEIALKYKSKQSKKGKFPSHYI